MRRTFDPHRFVDADIFFPCSPSIVLVLSVLLIAVGTVVIAYQERWESLFPRDAAGHQLTPELPREAMTPCAAPSPALMCPDWNRGQPFGWRPGSFPPVVPVPPILHRENPKYSVAALERRISGVVLLQIGIRRDGSVGGVCVQTSLPCGLDESAVRAVQQWRFQPVLIGGKPADVVSNLVRRPASSFSANVGDSAISDASLLSLIESPCCAFHGP